MTKMISGPGCSFIGYIRTKHQVMLFHISIISIQTVLDVDYMLKESRGLMAQSEISSEIDLLLDKLF